MFSPSMIRVVSSPPPHLPVSPRRGVCTWAAMRRFTLPRFRLPALGCSAISQISAPGKQASGVCCLDAQAVVPVGKLQERVLLEFASLITAFRQARSTSLSPAARTTVGLCRLQRGSDGPKLVLTLETLAGMRQVELANVRSFYKSDEKSPFKNFPWKTGTMHFHYLSVRATHVRQALTVEERHAQQYRLMPTKRHSHCSRRVHATPLLWLCNSEDGALAGSCGAASKPAGGAACASQGHGGHWHLLLSVHSGCCPRVLRVRATMQVR